MPVFIRADKVTYCVSNLLYNLVGVKQNSLVVRSKDPVAARRLPSILGGRCEC